MRLLVILTLLAMQSDMAVPTVTHKDDSYTQKVDTVTRKCPDGYEGHFVDQQAGFGWDDGYFNGGYFIPSAVFTICFKKSFMDDVRKNKDLSTVRPDPPRGV